MSQYTPDAWVVIRIIIPDADEPVYKVMGGWYGGYTGADSWRLNSGIKKIEETERYYQIHGHTGSVYFCHKETERPTSLMTQILDLISSQAEKFGGTVERITIPDVKWWLQHE